MKYPSFQINHYGWHCFVVSLIFNMYLLYINYFCIFDNALPIDGVCQAMITGQVTAATTSTPQYRHFGKEEAEGFSFEEYRTLSELALQKAATFSGERGEGRLGWLWLLASLDYDRTNVNALYNVVNNYHDIYSGFSVLAYTELNASRLNKRDRLSVMSKADVRLAKAALQKVQRSTREHSLPLPLPNMCSIKAFVTFLSTWDLSDSTIGAPNPAAGYSSPLALSMNDQIYAYAVAGYEALRARRPELSATDLNHELFRIQMDQLEGTATYWDGFSDVAGFDHLVGTMRRAASLFLQRHGMNTTIAELKSSHPLVVWASVHSVDSRPELASMHQPHVTDDALVGGVYYVRTPPGSGQLHIFDPRGKSPLDLRDPMAQSSPPFHRGVRISPKEGKLVLFPGWLVHSVVPATSLNQNGPARIPAPEEEKEKEDEAKDKSKSHEEAFSLHQVHRPAYRVSLSLNLKGEWYDTSSLHYKEGKSC